MLDEVPLLDGFSHGLEVGEVVVHAVNLSFPTAPSGVAAPKPKLLY